MFGKGSPMFQIWCQMTQTWQKQPNLIIDMYTLENYHFEPNILWFGSICFSLSKGVIFRFKSHEFCGGVKSQHRMLHFWRRQLLKSAFDEDFGEPPLLEVAATDSTGEEDNPREKVVNDGEICLILAEKSRFFDIFAFISI